MKKIIVLVVLVAISLNCLAFLLSNMADWGNALKQIIPADPSQYSSRVAFFLTWYFISAVLAIVLILFAWTYGVMYYRKNHKPLTAEQIAEYKQTRSERRKAVLQSKLEKLK